MCAIPREVSLDLDLSCSALMIGLWSVGCDPLRVAGSAKASKEWQVREPAQTCLPATFLSGGFGDLTQWPESS
jgi:hypothetical protein